MENEDMVKLILSYIAELIISAMAVWLFWNVIHIAFPELSPYIASELGFWDCFKLMILARVVIR